LNPGFDEMFVLSRLRVFEFSDNQDLLEKSGRPKCCDARLLSMMW
jgi:hypothetical protein